jgi:hypothetical protein
LLIFGEKITKFFNIKKIKLNTLIPTRGFFFKIPQVGAQVGDQCISSIFTSPNQVSPLLKGLHAKYGVQGNLGLVMEVL